MLKSMAVLGMLALLGGGTYVTVKSVGAQAPAGDAAATPVVAEECAASPCCAAEQAPVAKAEEKTEGPCPIDGGPCPLEGQDAEQTATSAEAPAAPAPAVQ